MTYLNCFLFPNKDQEHDFFMGIRRTCYDSYYPFQILSDKGLLRLDFAPVMILYGGNGSGKSTALNIIGEKLQVKRKSAFNKSNFYGDYVCLCEIPIGTRAPENSKIITSDDIFDYMLNIRHLNEGIDLKREELFLDYKSLKYAHFQLNSLAELDHLKRVNKSRSKTQSKFVRSELMDNIRTYSNGESAYRYFVEEIGENGLFILDEPENSLSPKRQIDLKSFIEDSARFFGCQFIISTHSTFFAFNERSKNL